MKYCVILVLKEKFITVKRKMKRMMAHSFYFILGVLPTHMSSVPGASGGKKKATDSMELQGYTVPRYHTGGRN